MHGFYRLRSRSRGLSVAWLVCLRPVSFSLLAKYRPFIFPCLSLTYRSAHVHNTDNLAYFSSRLSVTQALSNPIFAYSLQRFVEYDGVLNKTFIKIVIGCQVATREVETVGAPHKNRTFCVSVKYPPNGL